MPRLGFEPTNPVFRQAKTIHVLDRAATVIDMCGVSDNYTCASSFTITQFTNSRYEKRERISEYSDKYVQSIRGGGL
jgi:hypothetical protein